MPDFFHSIPIDAKPKDVYAAVATEKGMQGWWTRDTVMEEKVGGKADFGFDKREAVFHMEIKALKPGKTVKMSCISGPPEWTGTKLEWTIEAEGSGSVLSFSHRGWRKLTPFAASCNSMWGHLMFRIKKFVETGKPEPQWTE